MKYRFIFFPIVASLILISCNSAKQNDVYLFSYFMDNGQDGLHLAYSNDAYNWVALNNNNSYLTPELSSDKLMRDPCIIQGPDGLFHMVWTISWTKKSIGYANSKDLINWSEQKLIPVMENEPNALNCWAPEITWDSKTKKYVIIWSTTIPGKFPETDFQDNNGEPGKGYNHRMYCTTTTDFIDFTETKLFYDHGFNVIDGTINSHNDNYYLVLKDESNTPFPVQKNLKIATSKSILGNYSKPSEQITPKGIWVEGPTILELDGKWIIYFDQYRKHKMGAIESTDFKNWTDISEKISFPDGTRHGTVFKVSQKILDNLIQNNN